MEKFSDSQQQEAWRGYAKAALEGNISHYFFGILHGLFPNLAVACSSDFADRMLAEEMKRARGQIKGGIHEG